MFSRSALIAGSLFLASACSESSPKAGAELDPAAAAYVLRSLPRDVGQRAFIDFGGRAHLVGYTLTPSDVAPPGSTVKLTLYWRSVAPLGEGWSPVTQLLVGRRVLDVPSRSVLSQNPALAASSWKAGQIYVDSQDVQIPRDTRAPEVTLAVGFRRESPAAKRTAAQPSAPDGAADEAPLRPDLRLPVLSGPSDGQERGLVAVLRTGLAQAARAEAAGAAAKAQPNAVRAGSLPAAR
ncbi:MAG TPA: hypothetical protein VER33_12025 [Polyangiaceae bacterium]|nr:hypothetical protein [Polyangiaceae bacterium]